MDYTIEDKNLNKTVSIILEKKTAATLLKS
jgi:hypothetical protein